MFYVLQILPIRLVFGDITSLCFHFRSRLLGLLHSSSSWHLDDGHLLSSSTLLFPVFVFDFGRWIRWHGVAATRTYDHAWGNSGEERPPVSILEASFFLVADPRPWYVHSAHFGEWTSRSSRYSGWFVPVGDEVSSKTHSVFFFS